MFIWLFVRYNLSNLSTRFVIIGLTFVETGSNIFVGLPLNTGLLAPMLMYNLFLQPIYFSYINHDCMLPSHAVLLLKNKCLS